MLHRCFDEKFKIKWPTYKECTCSENFEVFQYFAKWMSEQQGFSPKCHLDKDLLKPGNKHYSEALCVLLPHEVNTLLIHKRLPTRGIATGVFFDIKRNKFVAQVNRKGRYEMIGRYESEEDAEVAYSNAKKAEIQRVAEEFKFSLDPRAYNALINYKV